MLQFGRRFLPVFLKGQLWSRLGYAFFRNFTRCGSGIARCRLCCFPSLCGGLFPGRLRTLASNLFAVCIKRFILEAVEIEIFSGCFLSFGLQLCLLLIELSIACSLIIDILVGIPQKRAIPLELVVLSGNMLICAINRLCLWGFSFLLCRLYFLWLFLCGFGCLRPFVRSQFFFGKKKLCGARMIRIDHASAASFSGSSV